MSNKMFVVWHVNSEYLGTCGNNYDDASGRTMVCCTMIDGLLWGVVT